MNEYLVWWLDLIFTLSIIGVLFYVLRYKTDSKRLDALERMVKESAEHGEAVELDGRGSSGEIYLYRFGTVSLAYSDLLRSTGADLRAAIDAAMGQEAKTDE